MGNEMSEKQREEQQLDAFVKSLPEGPDVRVGRSIVTFCGTSSSENLKQHYEQRKAAAGVSAAGLIRTLGEKLTDLTPAPALVGLGALAIAMILDEVYSSPEESTIDVLRSAFAEEKASEVWDQIDECLKRYAMHIDDKEQLKSDTERIECHLSTALTKLKNSLVRDGQMTTPGLRAWVNGAAFHVQMLIHLVRLGGIQTCDPVRNLLALYEKDLGVLFEKHRDMVQSKCKLKVIVTYEGLCNLYSLIDEESQWHDMDGPFSSFDQYKDAYYDQTYTRQKHDVQKYFSEVRENLQLLVQETGLFSIC